MVRSSRYKHQHDGNDDFFEITDYTQASSWENLIARLEEIIQSSCESRKSSFEHSIQYNNSHYQLVYISPINTSTLNKSEISKISKLKYNALRDNGPNVTELSTLLSAFSIALHNCACYLPAFVGFDEKRYENFIGYMYAPISSKSLENEDHFFVKFATESIILSTLSPNQNIAESFEKQLKIFYSKISVDPDDRNWDQFLNLSTTSTKYTYIKGNWNDIDWRNAASLSSSTSSSVDYDNEIFRWGYPMDPINELHYCVISPPIKSTHILENDFQSSQTPKSWFVKVLFRKPHNSLFQLSIGVINIFTSYVESIKLMSQYNPSIQQILTDYNLNKTSSTNPSSSSKQKYQSQHHNKTQNASDQNEYNDDDNQSQNYKGTDSILKTMGTFTKSLASSLSSPLIPTSRELEQLLQSLFTDSKDPSDIYHFDNIPEEDLNAPPLTNKSTRIKRAPIDSLFFSFSLMCLNIQSLVGVLLFWSEFVDEIKWHWEHQILIPRTFSSSHISVNNCLIFQKLQMINYCVKKRHEYQNYQETEEQYNSTNNNNNNEDNDNSNQNGWDDEDVIPTTPTIKGKEEGGWDFDEQLEGLDDQLEKSNLLNNEQQEEIDPVSNNNKKLTGQYLLYEDREINIPKTQDFGPMTDDMVNDHLNEMSDIEMTQEKRLELQTVTLLSDMQSFKYSNPGCVFEDFIRWHSNGDWITKPNEMESINIRLKQLKQEELDKQKIADEFTSDQYDEIKPIDEFDESKGRERKSNYGREGCLSLRMAGNDTIWKKTWAKAKPIPISKQKPLFDFNKQATNAISYLENILPSDLIHQIMSVILTSIATIFSNEKNKSNLSSEYCLGMDFQPMRQLVEKYFETVNQTWPSQIPNYESIKSKDFDPIFKTLQDIENSYSKLISLKTKFSKLNRVIYNLYRDGCSDILDNEFDSVSYLFFNEIDDYEYEMENNGIPTSIQPNVKEYITRSYSPRPYKTSQIMPHKMYTHISPYECRIATSISEEDI
ncbi:hypothetical protein DICPUDRAFT_149549 [Dictyostelium purpureum]|uniref:Rab3 GTPase-activating protein catalytic subunit n=1 Tax=Dictyostelium purpureum TaxID=5786 RepID=F0ZE20_DICPU|nr:uncharacterized protein DICPUDRAFT_149549 [Dictyostelium purpureum]EGC37835.1 hypothetical protein DICPUDRAFT_149549 [Dictyostelium purpureum]|eukprot:XP_003285680.1 hypothetical protein DICPUDRAFT_149549 [Dictyostelium purpureum]